MQNLIENGEQLIEYNISHNKKSVFYFINKRLMDIVGSVIGIIISSPIMLLAAIAIKLDSKGPVFFVQKRVGINGKLFKMYKFRSMVFGAEKLKLKLLDLNEMSGPVFKIKNDPRITRVGKFIRRTSIDEFPQFFNVLKGDMSIVGPRPNLPHEVEKFDGYQMQKLKAKPGLTCYWQVLGRNSIGFDEWMQLDIKYLQERSLFVDFKLIFKTFRVLFGDKNAS